MNAEGRWMVGRAWCMESATWRMPGRRRQFPPAAYYLLPTTYHLPSTTYYLPRPRYGVANRSTVAECIAILTRKLVVWARKLSVMDQKVASSGQKVFSFGPKSCQFGPKSWWFSTESTSFPLSYSPPPTIRHSLPTTSRASNRKFALPFQKVTSFRQKFTSFPLFCHTFKDLHERGQKKSCQTPAVAYIERYYPHLVDVLAPIVSPMVAMAESLRVLIVDDEPGMRLGAERALAGFVVSLPEFNGDVSFAVELAGTGEEALAKIAATPPDILLLDHKLPGISGLEILSKILESKAEILTIMMTAYASLDTAITATRRGAYDFLAKPFTPSELKASVRKAVKHLLLQREARRLAQEKRQVRFQFISVLAHELKAPLAAIEGYLNIMADKSLGSELPAYQQMVDRSLVRVHGMRKLILDLLDLTRIESGNRKREHVPVDVRAVAQMALDTAQPDAKERRLTLNLRAPEAVWLQGDPGEVEIMLNNLVSNAVKYNRDGGRVDVDIAAGADEVKVAVADTGIGMTEEEAGRLFRDFVRIKNEKTRNILGSGLGLSILKKLAQLYGGSVSVQSKPGEGSVFTLVLKLNVP